MRVRERESCHFPVAQLNNKEPRPVKCCCSAPSSGASFLEISSQLDGRRDKPASKSSKVTDKAGPSECERVELSGRGRLASSDIKSKPKEEEE